MNRYLGSFVFGGNFGINSKFNCNKITIKYYFQPLSSMIIIKKTDNDKSSKECEEIGTSIH